MEKTYTFLKEEEWINPEDINLSKEFLKRIEINEKKIIEIKIDKIDKIKKIKFIYVGIMSYKEEIAGVLPKYYEGFYKNEINSMVDLIKVFKKIPKDYIFLNKEVLFISNDTNDENASELSIADYIIKDYILNGDYKKIEERKSLNMGGEIDWNETINTLQPIISNGYPIYHNVYNINIYDNREDIIIKIYEKVLKYCIGMYAELLDYDFRGFKTWITKKDFLEIGSIEYILAVIQSELNNSYSDREVSLLRAMYNFFKLDNIYDSSELSLFGTTAFEYIWEYVTGFVFKNQYEKLSKNIPPLEWEKAYDAGIHKENRSLNPDVLRLHSEQLLILDAKYYLISFSDKGITGHPGSYDIVKQYTYQLAFEKLGFKDRIVNILLYPKEMNKLYEISGTVKLDIFDMPPIVNIHLSTGILWNMFLGNKIIKDEQLDEILEKIEFHRQM